MRRLAIYLCGFILTGIGLVVSSTVWTRSDRPSFESLVSDVACFFIGYLFVAAGVGTFWATAHKRSERLADIY